MILSGNNSYYDDYIRKKGTNRTLNDPPSLLTDRGAYVNFLEVQLERVSAACLGVQSYDQRFNDMQNLIVSLEQRCGSTTKLVSLSQQCTEEVRSISDKNLKSIAKEVKDERNEMLKMQELMSLRITNTEQTIASHTSLLNSLPIKIEELDKKMIDRDVFYQNEILRINEKQNIINEENINLNEKIQTIFELIGKIQTSVSKQSLEVEENERRLSNRLTNLDDRNDRIFNDDRDTVTKKLKTFNENMLLEIDNLQKSFTSKEFETYSLIRRVKENLEKELETSKEEFQSIKKELNQHKEQNSSYFYDIDNNIIQINDEIKKKNILTTKTIKLLEEELDSNKIETTEQLNKLNDISKTNTQLVKEAVKSNNEISSKFNDITCSGIFGSGEINGHKFEAWLQNKVNDLTFLSTKDIKMTIQNEIINDLKKSNILNDENIINNKSNYNSTSNTSYPKVNVSENQFINQNKSIQSQVKFMPGYENLNDENINNLQQQHYQNDEYFESSPNRINYKEKFSSSLINSPLRSQSRSPSRLNNNYQSQSYANQTDEKKQFASQDHYKIPEHIAAIEKQKGESNFLINKVKSTTEDDPLRETLKIFIEGYVADQKDIRHKLSTLASKKKSTNEFKLEKSLNSRPINSSVFTTQPQPHWITNKVKLLIL